MDNYFKTIETVLILSSLIGLIISVVVLIKFFQMAADLRALRQATPLTYKKSYFNPAVEIEIAKKAIMMSEKNYAKKILLISLNDLNQYPNGYQQAKEEIAALLAELE